MDYCRGVNDTQGRVVTSVAAHVAEVRLNRPDKHNGLDLKMFEHISAAGDALVNPGEVRAVVLHGAGKSFCAGLDFKAMVAGGEAMRARLLDRPEGRPSNLAQHVGWVWRRVPVPVIAALHGSCVGGGLQIALGADVRIAHPDTQISIREVHWGLIPDMGITVTLGGGVRLDVVKELTFSGRIIDGREAHALGLVTRLSEAPLDDARALAGTIAGRSPDAVRAAKRLWNEGPGLSEREALELESNLQIPLLGSANQMEAVRAGFTKESPNFKDP